MTHNKHLLSNKKATLYKTGLSSFSTLEIRITVIMMLIKTAFTLVCLISNLHLVNCRLCTDCTDITLLFNNAEELPSKCEGKFVEADVCQAIFGINYLTKQINLKLTGTTDSIGNYRLNLLVRDKFDEPKMKDANITYTCNTTTDCAKSFYQSTVQTLIQNERILNEIGAELFDPTVLNVQQCSNDQDQPVTCENGYGCHGYEIIENGATMYEGQCRNASTITIFPRLYFDITLVQGDPPLASDWNHFGFSCNKRNLCNTRQQIKKMIKLANDFYPWELIGLNSSAKHCMTYNYILLLLAVMLAVVFG
jgi:hypothetical protein